MPEANQEDLILQQTSSKKSAENLQSNLVNQIIESSEGDYVDLDD